MSGVGQVAIRCVTTVVVALQGHESRQLAGGSGQLGTRAIALRDDPARHDPAMNDAVSVADSMGEHLPDVRPGLAGPDET